MPCDTGELDHDCCSLARSHPAPCRSPRAIHRPEPKLCPLALPASSKAGGSPRAIPRSSRSAVPLPARRPTSSGEKDASHRSLQPTPYTSTNGLADSRSHACLARLSTCLHTVPAHPGPKPASETPTAGLGTLPLLPRRMSQPGRASLDGEPPASCDLAERLRRPVACAHDHRICGAARSWRSHDR